jgi:hypothetical protein
VGEEQEEEESLRGGDSSPFYKKFPLSLSRRGGQGVRLPTIIDMSPPDIYNKIMRVNFMPKTLLGRWSAGLIAGFFLFLVSFLLLVASGQRGGDTFFSNLVLTVPILLAGTCGVSAFLTGLIGIIRSKERAILVYLAVAIGFFVLFFWLGEILFPH